MSQTSGGRTRRIAVIVNPTKFSDLDAVREGITSVCADEGWAEPLWIETTADDPGVGQAARALDEGVDIVCPLGGDGTVRAVATTLVGTDRPLGLLPGGTGNLLARNLELPVDSIESALRVVLTGTDRRIDVGLVRLLPDSPSQDVLKGDDSEPDDPRRDDEEVFLVMTGIGVDAEVMANTNEKVKGVLGWPAYVVAGVARMGRRGFRVSLSADGGPPQRQHGQSVMVGNCGTLQGNLQLMPDARLDDGVLDSVIMAPKGPMGWLALGADLMSRHHRGHPRLYRATGRSLTVICHDPVETQIDGDPMGAHYGLTTRVLPSALVVRAPGSLG
ncbi:MAG: diacylglycerol kinase family protein [Lapillicoccus sp.]